MTYSDGRKEVGQFKNGGFISQLIYIIQAEEFI